MDLTGASFMRSLILLLAIFIAIPQASAKAVFAHFMVGNTEKYTIADWKNDISLAQDAHIDAFALNMAHGEATNEKSVADAFTVAESLGFKLFFSFDYAGNGAWPKAEVISLLQKYSSSSAHYRHNGQAFVSTFEGPANANDWVSIKSETGCFFVPDWSSVGAKPALELAGGVADGLFSWAAWPWGSQRMNTYVDASYLQYLGAAGGKPYMMPVSPWFYTNMPGYDKNWAWHSDDLWYDRWIEVDYIQPEWVEIISWNDYGESHYIGPLNDKAYVAFTTGKAPYNYVRDMPHDGWRLQLPYVIDQYKNGKASVAEESLVVWYRKQSRLACDGGGTTGNTASQLQIEYDASSVFEDKIFFSALLGSNATVEVTIDGLKFYASWESEPDGGVGIYHGSLAFNLHLFGDVTVAVVRHLVVVKVEGTPITTTCDNGLANFNAWVGSATSGSSISAVSPKLSLSDQVCIAGSGAVNFAGLCAFTCRYGYCPVGACYCTAMGKQKELPKATGDKGYPANGDANYAGLCDFACNYGYCPKTACSTTQRSAYIPPSSPFTPPACTRGEGEGNLAGLCSFACAFGFCPIDSCTCLVTGALVVPPEPDNLIGVPDTGDGDEYQLLKGLCNFACSRGYCPADACKLSGGSEYDDGDDSDTAQVIIDSSIWEEANPAVSCGEDCVLVLPPYPLPTPSVVTFDEGYETVLNVAWETPSVTTLSDGEVKTTNGITHILQTTTIKVPHMTVYELHLWPVTVPTQTTTTTIYPMVRFPPQTVVITDDPNPLLEPNVTHSPVTRSITIPPYPWNSVSASDSRVKPVTYTSAPDKKNGPPCINRAKCDVPCIMPIFCHGPCLKNCGGGGFSASNDPDPLPNPEPGPGENPDEDDDNCTETATVTDEWVSCKTIDSTSTSCTTTSYHVYTGCRATPSATTTGVDACYSVDPYADQGEDGGVPSGYVTTTDDRRITTITQHVPSTTTQRPERTHTVDGGVLRCMSDNNDFKQGDQDHFGTLDHFNSIARVICEQEQADFSSDRNGNYGLDYGRLDTPTKPILFFDIRKTSGNNCPPFPNFSAKNHDTEIEMCLQRFATIINSCDTAANGYDYWKQGGTFTKDCMQWSLTPV